MKKVENFVANGEIACFELFHLLSQYFQKSSAADAPNWSYRWERVKVRVFFNYIMHISKRLRPSILTISNFKPETRHAYGQ